MKQRGGTRSLSQGFLQTPHAPDGGVALALGDETRERHRERRDTLKHVQRGAQRGLLPLPAVAAEEYTRGLGLAAERRAVQRGGSLLGRGRFVLDGFFFILFGGDFGGRLGGRRVFSPPRATVQNPGAVQYRLADIPSGG